MTSSKSWAALGKLKIVRKLKIALVWVWTPTSSPCNIYLSGLSVRCAACLLQNCKEGTMIFFKNEYEVSLTRI